MIEILPAVDIKDGRCVRLRQGRAGDLQVYGDDPVEMARRWAGEGATRLHVVDLDGAFQGRPVHTRLIGRMAAAVAIPVEASGGLRTDAHIRDLLDRGVDRVVVGTQACRPEGPLAEWIRLFGARLVVGIDARDGLVQVRGWTETTTIRAVDLAARAAAEGVRTIVYTDTAVDGMLAGVNGAAVAEICDAAPCDVIASGGVASAADIAALAALRRPNLVGAIVGKALYEGRVTLRELLETASGRAG